MEFAFGVKVFRDRRKQIPSPYNPEETIAGSWDDPDTIELPGAFIASSTSASLSNETRSQVLTSKSLYLTDVTADVKVGDRIRGDSIYQVDAIPDADQNPFTGWQPAVEIPLKSAEG